MLDLTISIVSTDEKNVLDKCIDSLHGNMTHGIRHEIFVVDNANNVLGFISQKYPDVKLIVNKESKGFSENHNNVIRHSSGEYVLVMNPDVFIRESFIENMMDIMKADGKIGIVTGKLLRMDEKTIDSAGHVIYKNRRTIDRGQEQIDRGQFDRKEEVFSACGAAMMCRREMLEDIKLFGEYFDESFKLYKEDLDLSWRARLRGWKIVYVPSAIAYHGREWGKGKSRAKIPLWIRRESYKNRYLMMIKNDHFINFLRDLPFILWHELKALVYAILREPHLFLAWPQIISQVPTALRKRAEIMKKAIAKPEEMRKWFV